MFVGPYSSAACSSIGLTMITKVSNLGISRERDDRGRNVLGSVSLQYIRRFFFPLKHVAVPSSVPPNTCLRLNILASKVNNQVSFVPSGMIFLPAPWKMRMYKIGSRGWWRGSRGSRS